MLTEEEKLDPDDSPINVSFSESDQLSALPGSQSQSPGQGSRKRKRSDEGSSDPSKTSEPQQGAASGTNPIYISVMVDLDNNIRVIFGKDRPDTVAGKIQGDHYSSWRLRIEGLIASIDEIPIEEIPSLLLFATQGYFFEEAPKILEAISGKYRAQLDSKNYPTRVERKALTQKLRKLEKENNTDLNIEALKIGLKASRANLIASFITEILNEILILANKDPDAAFNSSFQKSRSELGSEGARVKTAIQKLKEFNKIQKSTFFSPDKQQELCEHINALFDFNYHRHLMTVLLRSVEDDLDDDVYKSILTENPKDLLEVLDQKAKNSSHILKHAAQELWDHLNQASDFSSVLKEKKEKLTEHFEKMLAYHFSLCRIAYPKLIRLFENENYIRICTQAIIIKQSWNFFDGHSTITDRVIKLVGERHQRIHQQELI